MADDHTVIYVLLGIIGLGVLIAIGLAVALPFIIAGPTGPTGATGTIGPTGPASYVSLTMGMKYDSEILIPANNAGPIFPSWDVTNLTTLAFNQYITGNNNLMSGNLFLPNFAGTWGFNYNITLSIADSGAGQNAALVLICVYRSDNTLINSLVYGPITNIAQYTYITTVSGLLAFDVSSDDISNKYTYNLGLYNLAPGTTSNTFIVPYLPQNRIGNPVPLYITNVIFQNLNKS